MCLITKQSESEPEILEEDLVVYKILTTRLESAYRSGFTYMLNKLYKTKIKLAVSRIRNFDEESWDSWADIPINMCNAFHFPSDAAFLQYIQRRECYAYGELVGLI